MKIIDKTPFQNAKGEIDFSSRIQATLKYGFNWYADMQAQQAVIAQLNRMLEKGFVLIRNFTLPNSEIVIPLILLGPGGVSVILVTDVKGFFEAKGDQWNAVSAGKAQPAGENVMKRVAQYSRALQVYFNRQKIQLPAPIESVLITANPGAHVESLRPVARVVMRDAIKQFAATVLQARPVWRSENIHAVAEQIVEPLPPEQLSAQPPVKPAPASPPDQSAAAPSKAKAIFDASANAPAFDPAGLDFAFDDANAPKAAPQPRPTSKGQSPQKPVPQKRNFFGMSMTQIAILAGILLCGLCAIVLVALYIFNQQPL